MCIYQPPGNYSKAINIHQESISIQKSIKDFLGLTRSNNHLAELYYKSGNYESSLESYLNAIKYLENDQGSDHKVKKALSATIFNKLRFINQIFII